MAQASGEHTPAARALPNLAVGASLIARRVKDLGVPLSDINNSKELEAWLEMQPPEISVAFAARVALRVLPLLQEVDSAGGTRDFPQRILLAVFRATALAWTAAAYWGGIPDLRSAARASGAFAVTPLVPSSR